MLRQRLAGAIQRLRDNTPGAQRGVAEPKVSIIIPMHGTARHVERCVRSATAQSLTEIEILCVDDASPDNCAQIVQRLARKDGRIRLIRHDRNRGLGGARNTGLSVARAPYVGSIDSDDHILPPMMEHLWQASGEGIADVVACGFRRVHADDSGAAPSQRPQPGRFRNDGQQLNIFEFLTPSFCTKIWKRSLFTEPLITFPENTFFEDLAVTPQLIHRARDLRVVDADYYRYFVRPGSISRSFSSKHILDHFRVFDILHDFLVREDLMERYGQALRERIGRSLAAHAAEVKASAMEEEDKRRYLRTCLMLQRGYLQLMDQLRDLPTEHLQAGFFAASGEPAC